jgi:RNA polymerase sigma factor (sigma-70 family)
LFEIIETESFIIRVHKIAAALFYKHYSDFQYKGMVFNINNVDDLVTEAYVNVCKAANNNNELKNFNEKQALTYFNTTIKNILKNCIKKKLAIKNNANIIQLQNEDYNLKLDQAYLYIERDNERNLNLALAISTIDEMQEIKPSCYKILNSLLRDLTYVEIAQDLDVSYSTFKVYVSRCRKLLVQNMEKKSKEIKVGTRESL